MNKEVTEKDLRKAYLRNLFFSTTGWNYEKMMGLGYCYIMMPFMRKMYTDEEQLKKRVKSQLQFYNCNAVMSNFIIGANMAVEEKEGIQSTETITALKTGLMGPLAGVGDTIFGVTWGTVFFSIAAYMALEGSPVGCIIAIIAGILKMFLGYPFLKIGFNEGTKLVDTVGGKIQSITEVATMVGLTVVGALIPTVVSAKTAFVYKKGDIKIDLQTDVLDKIMPALLPVCIVGLTYWLLGRKGLNSTRVIIILLVLSILLYNLRVLG
jgi:PTS system mannose-specific IID component